MENIRRSWSERGSALIIALLALFLFAVIGLYMTLNATTELCISDNFESQLQATHAALAGLNHAGALIRGLQFDDLLKGPDGTFDQSVSYINWAKEFSFRNPLPLEKALSCDIYDPSDEISGFPDDGLVNTGFYGGLDGRVVLPVTGVGIEAPDPYNSDVKLLSRYFVKVTDNNGDSSEIAGDLNDSPFTDGDGIVIVRSLGAAKTISAAAGSTARLNSVAVFEMRLKRLSTWDLGPALVVLGSEVNATFSGACDISGNSFPGIGTIDILPQDAMVPDQIIRTAADGCGEITGGGDPSPSVREISGSLNSNPDQTLVMDPRFLWEFLHDMAPRVADLVFEGSQVWLGGNAPYLGFFDYTKPTNAPEQDPKIVVVNGNLEAGGGLSGGGLLVVTGDLLISGPFAFNGLVLVIGKGNLAVDGSGDGITGGVILANLELQQGEIVFGVPSLSLSSSSRFAANGEAVRMAIGLLPASRISFREITNSDP